MKVMELGAESVPGLPKHMKIHNPGISGGLISLSVSGGQFVRIIHLLELPGTSFLMITRVPVHTGGAKTVCWVSATKSAACASLLACGMEKIPS